ncbi:hypothetical protein FS749_005711, partial [Ceratobasidium sp. UAMH 11750]
MLPLTPNPSTTPRCDNLDNFIPLPIRQRYQHVASLMCHQFKWKEARAFQVNGALLQLARCDAIIHVGTGRGKTAVAAAPYVLDENKTAITVLISPLIALQSEMETTLRDKFRVPAVALNSTIGTELTKVIRDILSGKYRIVLVSPETLLSHRVRGELLANHDFKRLIFSIIIDEAHVIAYWGREFRKKYSLLHIVRDYLPGVPVICLSATLTSQVIQYITSTLDMKNSSYAFINEGNERPELSLAVAKCQYPMNTFLDLLFLFKGRISYPQDIPKSFIFIDNKAEGHRAVQILNNFLPASLRHLGLIRPFNARHSSQYRAETMKLFQLGVIRVLICTDAAGMGCDISNVEIVIQWRIVALSILIQRWGRIRGERGLAVMLVEPSAYTYNPTEPGVKVVSSSSKKSGSRAKRSNKESLKKGGWKSPVHGAHPELRADSPYEGTLVLAQTNGCLREIWTRAFQNQPVAPLFECCSLQVCNPSLLERIKPPRMLHVKKKVNKAPKRGQPHLPTQER